MAAGKPRCSSDRASTRPDADRSETVLGVSLLPLRGERHPEIVRAAAFLSLSPCGFDVLLPEKDPHELRLIRSRDQPTVLRGPSLAVAICSRM